MAQDEEVRRRSRPIAVGFALALLALLTGPNDAGADETAVSVATDVIAAFEASDEGRLARLAAAERPDAWLVVDEVLARGARDAAHAFAGHAPDGRREGLVAYLEGPGASPVPAARRSALAAATGALAAGDAAAALDALPDPDADPSSVVAVRTLELRARALARLPRREQSEAAWRRAADVARRLAWWAAALHGLNEAGIQAYRRGALDAATQHWEDRLALEEAHGSQVGQARTLGNLGIVLRLRGRIREAREVQERALAVFKREGDELSAARTVGNLGRIHEDLGDLRRALSAYLDATARMERLGNLEGVAINIHNAGTAYTQLGDYARAWPALERALAIDRERGDANAVASDLLSIAVLQAELGRQEDEAETYEQILAIARQQQNPVLEASALRNLAAVTQREGQLARAHDLLEAALAIHRRLGQVSQIVLALVNLAAIHAGMGEHEEALALYRQALAAQQDSRLYEPLILVAQARVLNRVGRLEEAALSAEAALEAARSSGRLEEELQAWQVLAGTRAQQGRFPDALAAARQAARDVARLARGLSENGSIGVRERKADVFEVGFASALVCRDTEAATFFLEAGRAGALLESLGTGDALRSAVLPDALRRADDEARRHETAAAAALRRAQASGARTALRAAHDALEAAREEVEAVRARVRRDVKAAALLVDPAPDDLATIQARLEAGDALVLYGSTGASVVALVATSTAARLAELGPREPIDAAALQLDLADPQSDARADVVAELKRLVVEPLALGKRVRRLLVSPEGALSYVPFTLLLEEGMDVAYVPSATVYGVLADGAGVPGEGILALGDPDYGTSGERPPGTLRAGGRLVPLPATRDEVRAIGTRVLLGADATEAALRAALAERPHWRAVHLACHGLVRSDRPLLSSLAVTPSAEDDGFLTALDVFRLRVPADLVVLSACETARGRVVRGEGVVGLVSAFFHAGAPRVLASLWSVDDEATKALMVKFYELWSEGRMGAEPAPGDPRKAGVGAAQALRQAQAFVRDHPDHPAWAHPHYWAAWTLWGLP